MKQWVDSGAHRIDREGNGQYDDHAALALMDTWWTPMITTMFASTMGQGDLFAQFPMAFDDENRTLGLGSSFQDCYYGYVQKAVRMALGEWVGPALSGAVVRRRDLGGMPGRASRQPPAGHRQAGAGSQHVERRRGRRRHRVRGRGLITLDPQPWQNRPTFQQVVQVGG